MASSAGKATLKISSLLTLLILLMEYPLGASLETPLGLIGRILSGTAMKNASYIHDFIPLLTMLNHQNKFDIGILYNSKYKETIDETTDAFAKEVSGQRITGLTLLQYQNSTVIMKLLEQLLNPEKILVTFCSFTEVLDIFRKIRTVIMKSHLVKWVLIFNWKDFEEKSMVALQDLIFEGTQVTLVTREINGDYHILEANVNLSGDLRFNFRVRWENSFKSKRQQLVASQRRDRYPNMNGRRLIVGVVHSVQNPDGTFGFDPLDILERSVLQSLTRKMNFTYQIVPPPDGAWGHPQPDGSITGVIGMVARREAHFALNKISISAPRARVVEFTTTFTFSPLALVSRAPKEKNRALAVFSTFSLEVWICLVITTIVIGPILKIQSRVSQVVGTDKTSLDLQAYAFYMFRSLVAQGNPIITTNWPQRMILFSWYLFCFLIYAAYAGLLTAVLVVPAFEKPVDSLEDLPDAAANGFIVGTTGRTNIEYIFKEAKSGIYKQTWDLFNHKDRSKSFVPRATIGLERVLASKFIYIVPYAVADLFVDRYGRKNFHFGRELFYGQYTALAFPPGAPYMHSMSFILQRLTEGGLIRRWEKEEIEQSSKKAIKENNETKEKTITLVHLQAAFFILILGYLAANYILTMEVLSLFI